MKENNELERQDIAIDRDMEVDCDIGQEITCYIETWFDVDKKFGIDTASNDGTWLNLYGKYNPFEDTLRIECEISSDNSSKYFDYEPTASEAQMIKDMITQKIREVYDQTPQEFCEGALSEEQESVDTEARKVYVYQNHQRISAEGIHKKWDRIKNYCADNGYEIAGSTSISLPMSRCGTELSDIMLYMWKRDISLFVVDGIRDIGRDDTETMNLIDKLQNFGFAFAVIDRGMVFSQTAYSTGESDPNNTEIPEDNNSDEGLRMGGIT